MRSESHWSSDSSIGYSGATEELHNRSSHPSLTLVEISIAAIFYFLGFLVNIRILFQVRFVA